MEPVNETVGIIIVGLLLLFVFFWYIVPFVWRFVLKPLGRIAYFVLLLVVGVGFFVFLFVGKQLGIPEDVQLALAIFSGVIAGVKWAVKQT